MIKKLWCLITTGHKYEEVSRQMIEAGTNKLFVHKCLICSGVKRSTL